MSRAILIPVIHRPATPDWRDASVTHPACRVVPHYTGHDSVREGDETYGLASYAGFEANQYRPDKLMPTDWVKAPKWTGPLSVTGYHGGRSSSCYAVSIAADDGGEPVVGLMSCSNFCALVSRVRDGSVTGCWTAIKRGQNYMIEEAS